MKEERKMEEGKTRDERGAGVLELGELDYL